MFLCNIVQTPGEVLLLVPHLSLLWFQPPEQAGEAFGCSVAMNKSCIDEGGGKTGHLVLDFVFPSGGGLDFSWWN